MAGVIATIPKFQFSANGVPMVGGTLDTYIAGSTTPATTWQDSALTIANTNPISLDARGECVLWLDPAVVYKFVLKNAQGVIQWTQDNISNPAALANSLRADLAASSGAALVGGGDQVVASIAALRLLLKTSASKNALTTGYYTAGDGGGGARYYCDVADTTSSDNGCTVIVAADGGRWKMVFTGALSVHQAGAKGDGATNDRAAIQAAMNAVSASGGGTINFSAGKTYIVIPTANTSFILQNSTGIRLQGAPGATIKVAAAAGGYLGILGVDGGNPAVFNMTVDGLTFDHNTANNPLTTLVDIEAHTRSTFAVWQGANIRFTNNTVKNDSSMLSLDLNGQIVSDIFVENNKFLNCGMTSNAIDHDHSTIYCMADNMQIVNNVFITDWTNKSCRTAIETHGSRYNVSGNTVLGYICGVIVTGIHYTNSTQQTIIGNSITSRAQGITVWSQSFAGTTGYGIEGVLISDNIINIKQASYYKGGDVVMGIGIYPNATLGVKELNIVDNNIEFELENSIPSGYTGNVKSVGLGWNLNTNALPIVNCAISRNRVLFAPVAGIAIIGGHLVNLDVSNNTLVNCAGSVDATLNAYRIPLVAIPNSAATTLNIERNRITDNFATTRARSAMLLSAQTAGAKCECLGNDINIEGGSGGIYLTSHTISGGNMVPLIKDTANLALLPAAGSCAEGSTFAGKGDSRTYRYIGGKWLARSWSDTIPAVAGTQGDYAENRLKTVGKPKGWWCTGGTTWVSDGNL